MIAYCTGLYYDWTTSFVSFSDPTSPTLYNKFESRLPQTSWDNLNHDCHELTHLSASEFSDTKLAGRVFLCPTYLSALINSYLLGAAPGTEQYSYK